MAKGRFFFFQEQFCYRKTQSVWSWESLSERRTRWDTKSEIREELKDKGGILGNSPFNISLKITAQYVLTTQKLPERNKISSRAGKLAQTE